MNQYPIVGIIAEYDPYHNGHLFQMNQAKALTGAPWCVVVLSGSFVQRGEPAFYSSAVRARMALSCGADAVFEIPAPFSSASAADYAFYGVSLLGSLGIPFMSCGTENASAEEISGLAEILNTETPVFKNALQKALKNGISFPAARSLAISEDLSSSGADSDFVSRTQEILSTPNNILAIEYAKAILFLGSPLKLITVNRQGSSYHDKTLNGTFSSASAIRNHVACGQDPDILRESLPEPSFRILLSEEGLNPDAFTGSIVRRIIDLKYQNADLSRFADVPEDMGNRILSEAGPQQSLSALIDSVKSKQYTSARISRALMHIFLGITKESMALYKKGRPAPYARLIGFRRSSEELLGILKENASVPLLCKTADAPVLLHKEPAAMSLLLEEAHAADLWNSVYFDYVHKREPNLFEREIVIV